MGIVLKKSHTHYYLRLRQNQKEGIGFGGLDLKVLTATCSTTRRMGYITRRYRKVFGHKSPYRRVYGSRNAGQAIGTTWRMATREAPKAAKLAMEIAKIKRSLNVEKKHNDTNQLPIHLGQVNFDSEGAVVREITPLIGQGTDAHQRTGNSCKLTGFALKYQMIGDDLCHSARRIRIMLVKSRDAVADTGARDVLSALYDVNPLTGVRDLNAPRNYSSMKHHGITVLRTKTCYVKPQNIHVLGDRDNSHLTGTFTASMQDVLRFTDASDNKPDHVHYYLIFQADVGNAGSQDSTLSVPVRSPNTAVNIESTLRTWWVDN